MVLVDKKGIQRIHGLLAKKGLANDKDFKRELVMQYTDGRETSTTGLFSDEASLMITDLQKLVGLTPDQIKADAKRKLILHYAHEMLWYKPENEWKGAEPELDMGRIDGWCVKSGYLHKPLNDYELAELSKLVWQFQQVHTDFLNAV